MLPKQLGNLDGERKRDAAIVMPSRPKKSDSSTKRHQGSARLRGQAVASFSHRDVAG